MPTEFSGRGDARRTLQLLWRRDDRPTRGPRPALSVDAIVDTAIRVADAEGLAAVSMRRVADELGVGTMSLYRHVPGKGELVDLMLDRVVGEAPNPGPEVVGWRARLEAHARAAIEHYRRHPWAADLGLNRPPLGPSVMRNYEALLAAAAETGLPIEEWNAIAQAIGTFTQGVAAWIVQEAEATRATGVSEEDWWRSREIFWQEFYVAEDHPTLTRAYMAGALEDPPDAFEYGLRCLLDGIEARIRARQDSDTALGGE